MPKASKFTSMFDQAIKRGTCISCIGVCASNKYPECPVCGRTLPEFRVLRMIDNDNAEPCAEFEGNFAECRSYIRAQNWGAYGFNIQSGSGRFVSFNL